ncbi:MAG: hypothetical protein WC755_08520 [Candidatus Woesearchaeota archaeon]|jgi:hypothetical protein
MTNKQFSNLINGQRRYLNDLDKKQYLKAIEDGEAKIAFVKDYHCKLYGIGIISIKENMKKKFFMDYIDIYYSFKFSRLCKYNKNELNSVIEIENTSTTWILQNV